MTSAVVHQTVHGYNDGHRLIAGSVTLSSVEARTMQVMSDLSGPGVKPPAVGYLTGYPLDGSGRYVLARTWAAPEMPRPGCVWTHSLIVENADLGAMASASGLLAAFRRPDSPSHREVYGSPIDIGGIAPVAENLPATPAFTARALDVLNAIYAAPGQVVVLQAADEEQDELLVVSIWMQQWPRLRRSFGFCTLAKVDRSLRGQALDLQMVPSGERQLASKFKNAVSPSDVSRNPAVATLVADLFEPGGSQLRYFLRRTGGDVEGGRRAMIPLVTIYDAMFDGAPDLSGAVAAFEALDGFGRRQARSLRLIVARQAIERVEEVDDDVFEFLVDALGKDFGASDETDLGARFGTALWRRSPIRFVAALSDPGPVGQAANEAVKNIDAYELVAGFGSNAEAANAVARRRPDVLSKQAFWKIDGVAESLVALAADSDAANIARALIATGRSESAPDLISRADPTELAAAIEAVASDAPGEVAWLRALARNPDKSAAVLASGALRRAETQVALARSMGPDDVLNELDEDPWWIAVRAAKGELSGTDEDYLSAFLMARGLGRRSRSSADLFRRSFTTVHEALSQGRLTFEAERHVVARLDLGGWLDWDRVSRLRATVVARFVDDHLDPETFGRLSHDGQITKALIDEAAHTSRGRRYLDDVRKALKHTHEQGIRKRADYIAEKTR